MLALLHCLDDWRIVLGEICGKREVALMGGSRLL